MTDVTIEAADGGRFSGYLASPKSGRGPGLLVIQEIFGVNHVVRALCDRYAEAGYTALAPDLFWRQQPGVQLTDKTDAEWQQAFALMKGFNEVKGVEDMIATLNHLRALPGATGKVGAVGHCLGGRLAYLMATRSNVDCSVGYYGVGLDRLLDEATAITKPLLLHIAGSDEYCPPEAQARIVEQMSRIALATVHVYPGLGHAFARPGGAHYDKDAATVADRRTDAFLAENLAATPKG